MKIHLETPGPKSQHFLLCMPTLIIQNCHLLPNHFWDIQLQNLCKKCRRIEIMCGNICLNCYKCSSLVSKRKAYECVWMNRTMSSLHTFVYTNCNLSVHQHIGMLKYCEQFQCIINATLPARKNINVHSPLDRCIVSALSTKPLILISLPCFMFVNLILTALVKSLAIISEIS